MSEPHLHLEPCPFCGMPLNVDRRKYNPHARCVTEGCKGTQLPLLNLDMPEDIARWNTRSGVLCSGMSAGVSIEPDDDGALFRWACENGFPCCKRQTHPVEGRPFWTYDDMASSGYPTAKEAIQAEIRASLLQVYEGSPQNSEKIVR